MSVNSKICPKCQNLCKIEDYVCNSCGETFENSSFQKINKHLVDDATSIKIEEKEKRLNKKNYSDKDIPVPSTNRMLFAGYYSWFLASLVLIILSFNLSSAVSIFFVTDLSDAAAIVANSIEIDLVIKILFIAICSVLAGYIARKKGILTGLIGISIPLVIGTLLKLWTDGYFSHEIFIDAGMLIILGAIGGYIGQILYNRGSDRDIENIKLTLFGIRWYHHIWIILIIIPLWTTAFIYILTSFSVFAYDLFMFVYYVLGNPLRLFEHLIEIVRFLTMGVLFGILPLLAGSYLSTLFLKVMQYRNVYFSIAKKILLGISCGFIAPVILTLISIYTSHWIFLNVDIKEDIPIFGYIILLIIVVLGITKIKKSS